MPDTRSLYVVRHAKSAYPEGVTDHDRPLNGRGRADAIQLGVELAARCAIPDRVLVSTAVRAQETWRAASQVVRATVVRADDALYLASAADLQQIVQATDEDVVSLIVVGHNDGLSEFVTDLTGEDVLLKTATFAVLTSQQPWLQWQPGLARLREVVRARSS